MLSFLKRNDDRKELEELKQEYENELEKLKRKVSDYDTTVLMHYNNKLREENKRLKELIQVYEKFIPQNKSQTSKTTFGKEEL